MTQSLKLQSNYKNFKPQIISLTQAAKFPLLIGQLALIVDSCTFINYFEETQALSRSYIKTPGNENIK